MTYAHKFLTLSLLVIVASCATIVTGSKQLVTINSNVPGALVYLDGNQIGQTPFTGEIEKGKKMLTLKKEGYVDYEVALSTSLEGWFWGNILVGGTLGSTTDMATGAAYSYSPASFQVDLRSFNTSLHDFEKAVQLKKFAMINMSNLVHDIHNGDGSYVNALLKLANLSNTEANIAKIDSILRESNGSQVAFGSSIGKLLL